MHITPVVRNLLIINIIMFIASMVIPNLTELLALYPPMSPSFKPYQIVTHFFMHGSIFHIVMNMFVLMNIGPVLEMSWRAEKFLFYYLFCAIGAAVLQCAINYYQYTSIINAGGSPLEAIAYLSPMVGASGAIFGLIVAIAFYFPNVEFQIFPIPIPIKAKYFVPLLVLVELFLGVKNFSTDIIAHFAHLGGALSGIILLLYWGKK